jgi:hypothetical protein
MNQMKISESKKNWEEVLILMLARKREALICQ